MSRVPVKTRYEKSNSYRSSSGWLVRVGVEIGLVAFDEIFRYTGCKFLMAKRYYYKELG